MKSCLDTTYLTKQCEQQLICPICLQIMIAPYRLTCGHNFGISCIKKWKNKQCPLCRQKYDQLTPKIQLKSKICQYMAVCKFCKISLKATQVNQHLKQCESFLTITKSQILDICEKERQILAIEISPHLQQQHTQIYKTYVDEWRWLQHDVRDWKWWWWSSNSWWNNQHCQQCNYLWHKYEKQIDNLEAMRIQILEQTAFSLNVKK